MNELIDNLLKHKNDKNYKYCNEIIEIIQAKSINSIKELKKYEDDHFTFIYPEKEEKISEEEIINLLSEEIEKESLDDLDLSKMSRIELLKKEIDTIGIKDIQFKDLIEVMYLLNLEMVLPYHAYEYIVSDKM